MGKNLLKAFIAFFLILKASVSFSQNFTANWTFASDSLSTVTGNVAASGAMIDPTLFTRLRSYGPAGLKGMGTNGKTTTPACNALYNSAGATTPISPYMEMSMSPNAGYSASVNAFSFSVKGDSISSANMVICAGYSTDGGVSFTGFNITKNNTPISPAPGTTGTSIATGDSLVFTAPALNIASASSLKIRIIYWKNATGSTSGNRIVIGSVLLSGTTSGSVSNTPTIGSPVPSSLSGLTYVVSSGPSAEQSFSVSATNLTSNISVTAPSNFEVSTTSGTGFGASATIASTAGAVNAAMVYVRLKSGLSVNTYNGNVSLSSTGATAQTVACAGTVTNPAPIITSSNPTNLTGFSYGFGNGPSAAQSFTVSGQNLTDTLKIALTTANFEISLSPNSGYVSNATATNTPNTLIKIAPIAGVVAPTMIYARLKAGLNASSTAYLSKKVTISSTGATSVIDTLNGIVFNPTISATPNNLPGFNYTVASGPSVAQSFSVTARVSVPVGIKAPASYEISLSNATGYTDSLTLSPVSDSVSATNIFVRLKSGLSVGNYNDSVVVTSNAATTQSVLCNGSVSAVPVPTISTPSSSTLSGFTYLQGSGPSPEQSFTISGTNLTTGITISASTNYEVSTTSGSGFGASVTLTANAGVVSNTTIYVRLKGSLSAATYNGESITIGSTGATSQYVTCNGSVLAPSAPIISLPTPTSLSGFSYLQGSGPSSEQSFSISANNLTSNLSITASASFEVSQTAGAGYTSTISLTPASGVVGSSMIYVRMKAGLTSNIYNESISITSTGASAQAVSCSGTVSTPPTPVISSPTPTSLTGFSYALGNGPSAERSFTISGSDLTSNITVTAPSSYEISTTSGSGFSNSVSLTPIAGSVSNTTIYVRMMASLTAGSYNESIDIASTGAVAQSLACSGTVNDPGVLPNMTAVWPFVTDSLATTTGNVTAAGAHIDPILFRTSRTYGPDGLTGTGTSGLASGMCNATFDSILTISPYMEMSLAPNTGYSATLNPFSFKIKANTLSSANMYIAAGYSADGGTTFTGFSISRNGMPDTVQGMNGIHLWTNDSLVLSAPALSIAAGSSLKMRIIYWKNNNSNTTANPITIGSVNVTGNTQAATTTPFISSPTPASLTGFSYVVGAGPSTEQHFTISGMNLTNDITVAAPSNYEVSTTSGSGFGTSVVLTATAGTVSSTMVYVRLKAGLSVAAYNENISITSSGANSQSVACAGNVVSTPTPTINMPTPMSLSGFSYVLGAGPSAEHSFTIGGQYLTNDITVTASTNFEVSTTSGAGFGASVSLTPTAGTVSNTMVYVRLKAGLTVGLYNETIDITSTGATAQNVSCAGTVTDQTTTPDVSAVWPFVTDTLATTTGNISAEGAYIDQTLFRTSRTYGPNGLTGAGTTGIASPTCNDWFDSVGSVITPYMEMSLAPNAGYSASLNPFSFKISAGTITSTSMYIAAGYSEDGGLTFTGFNISRNGLPDSVQGVNGIHLWSNDSLRLSAPALSIASGSSLKIRIIYWKNNNSTTSANPITIGSVAITGTTAVDCSSINASISGKSFVANTNSNDAVFTIAGTSGAEVTYNINGGTNATTTLNQGTSTITINNISSDQTIRLISVTKGSCSKVLNSTATVNVPTMNASFSKGYSVYPNPVTQGNVNIMFQDIAQGNYLLRLFNNVGQVLYSKEISHDGGNVLQTINFGKQFADGCYLIEIRNMSNGKKTVKQVIFANQ